jgi:hypothetical protein
MPSQAQNPHQPLYAFAVHPMALRLQERHHLAAAIEWTAGVLLVNQPQQI